MLTDLGPGIVPLQFALILSPQSTALYAAYYAVKYVTLQRLEAAGWATRDPLFFDQCCGARPQGAMELSWLPQHVLQGTLNPQLPRIPSSQVRYMSARVYAVLTRNIASILESIRPAFAQAISGSRAGMGITAYGPMTLPMAISLTDVQARREHYQVSLVVRDSSALAQFAHNNQQTVLGQLIQNFGNGGVEMHFTYTSLPQRNRPSATHNFDLIFPLDPLRVILRAQERITHAQGRLAALI